MIRHLRLQLERQKACKSSCSRRPSILRNSESFADYDTRCATFRPRSLITTTTNRARRRGLLPAEVSRPTTPRYFPLAEISSPISDLNIPFPRLPCRVWIVNFVSIELILRNWGDTNGIISLEQVNKRADRVCRSNTVAHNSSVLSLIER